MVGAVIVSGGRQVGSGFHARAGEPHAEILALREAGERAKGGTLYVTLEPCNHYGRTPPCTDAILNADVTLFGAGYAYYSGSPLGGYFTLVLAGP